jgi:23S rRNA (cytosine1962-C5)-methyltransferase
VSPSTAVLGHLGAQRLAAGHPWVYQGQLAAVPEPAVPGVIRVQDERGRFLGLALFSPRSRIALRLLTRDDRPIDTGFLVERLRRAQAYRERILGPREACRQVFGESDGLPSLIVDQYGEHLVIQALSAGMEALKPRLIEALQEVFRPRSILARNDPSVRSMEGLPREVVQWAGETPPILTIREGDLFFNVDPWRGQKTGAFLDQAENHVAAAGYLQGRVLDAFAYNGGFGLPTARRAGQVVCVDSSAAALETLSGNAARNGLTGLVTVEANVFDFLKSADVSGEKFDGIILDPPAFAKNRSEVESGVRGYKEINLRAMKLLNPGGRLITCSCSYHITEDLFLDVMAAAAADVRRHFRLVEKRTQGRDHPVLVGFPESHYLKCLVLEFMD